MGSFPGEVPAKPRARHLGRTGDFRTGVIPRFRARGTRRRACCEGAYLGDRFSRAVASSPRATRTPGAASVRRAFGNRIFAPNTCLVALRRVFGANMVAEEPGRGTALPHGSFAGSYFSATMRPMT